MNALSSLERPMALVALAAGLSGQDVAERAVDPDSGHTYLCSDEPLTVYDALELARELGGTLVAIGSAAEETFLLENFGADEAYWIGLEFPRESWATGEPVGYVRWAQGEPNGGTGAPFTLMNWSRPGEWGDVEGDAERDRYRALIELPSGAAPPGRPAARPARPRNRGVLLCAIQGLAPRDLESPRNPSLNALWKRSAWTFDAGADGSADPLAGLGMILWGVGSARSRLSSADPRAAAQRENENLLSRLERIRPEVATAALLDDPALAGILIEGRVDVRASNASPRRGGTLDALKDALGREAPLCVVATWTDVRLSGTGKPDDAEHAREIAVIDQELGAVLAMLRARPGFAEEEWWIAVAGLAPVAGKKTRRAEEDLRARSAVPLCIVAPAVASGEILADVLLVDLVPAAFTHLGIESRRSLQLDGRSFPLEAPAYGVNLIHNGGAEAQVGWGPAEFPLLTGWRQLASFRLGRHASDEPGPQERGQSFFQGGADPLARMEQTIDLRALAAEVDRGLVRFRLSGWLGSRRQSQASIELAVEFLNEQKKPLERAVLGPVGLEERRAALGAEKGVPAAGLVELETAGRVPRRARAARVVLLASGAKGVPQTMADELSLVLERE